MWGELRWFMWSDFVLKWSDVGRTEVIYVKWFCFEVKWSDVGWTEVIYVKWFCFEVKWSDVGWTEVIYVKWFCFEVKWSEVMWGELRWFVWSDFVLEWSEVMWGELRWFMWSYFVLKWSEVMWGELRCFMWSDFVSNLSEMKWVTVKFLGTKVSCTLGWLYTEGTWLYLDCFIWYVSCTVVVLTGFVMWGCFDNCLCVLVICVKSSWSVMAHGDARVGEVKEKLANGVGSQYPLHYLGTWCVSSITTADAHNSAASSRLNWRPRADLNGLDRFAERRNLVFCACAITFQT